MAIPISSSSLESEPKLITNPALDNLFRLVEGDSLIQFQASFESIDNPWQVDSLGRNVIHIAAVGAREEIYRFLFLSPLAVPHLNLQTLNGNTPVHLAALNGRKDAVALLLTLPSLDLSLRNQSGQTPLQLAADAGQRGVYDLLAARQQGVESVAFPEFPADDSPTISDSDDSDDFEFFIGDVTGAEDEDEERAAQQTGDSSSSSSAFSRDELRVSQVNTQADRRLQRARLLVGSGRHALTASVEQETVILFKDTRDMMDKVEILMQRYESDIEIFSNLILVHNQLFEAWQRCDQAIQLTSSLSNSSDASPLINLDQNNTLSSSTPSSSTPSSSTPSSPAAPVETEAEPNEGPTHDCQLCWDTVPLSRVVTLAACSHQYCGPCITDLLTNAINSGEIVNILCPEPSCRAQFSPAEIERLSPPQLFTKYQQFTFLAGIRANPNARWCPRPGCETPAIIDPADPGLPLVRCAQCHYEFCARCGGPHHQGVTCKRAESNRQRQLSRAQREAERQSSQFIAQNSKPCPSCGTLVSRDGGCAHMHCPSPPVGCGGEFCYLCGERILVGGTFPMHYKISQCAGLQFYSKDELPLGRKIGGVIMAPFRYGILGIGAVVTAPVLIPYKIRSHMRLRREREEAARLRELNLRYREEAQAEERTTTATRPQRSNRRSSMRSSMRRSSSSSSSDSGPSLSPESSRSATASPSPPPRSPSNPAAADAPPPPPPSAEPEMHVALMDGFEGDDVLTESPALSFQEGDQILISSRNGEQCFGVNQRTSASGWIHAQYIKRFELSSLTCPNCTFINLGISSACTICGTTLFNSYP